jgi:hypothetical protein
VRRLLQLVALLSARVWAGMVLWTRWHPGTETGVRVRTVAFCLLFGSVLLLAKPRPEGVAPEEETF